MGLMNVTVVGVRIGREGRDDVERSIMNRSRLYEI